MFQHPLRMITTVDFTGNLGQPIGIDRSQYNCGFDLSASHLQLVMDSVKRLSNDRERSVIAVRQLNSDSPFFA